MNYWVFYGVNSSHILEGKGFVTYRAARKFYHSLDREKWGAARVVKIESQGIGIPDKHTEKLKYVVR